MAVAKFLKAAKEIQDQANHRKAEPKKQAAEDGEGWLVSYADMMTLLCGFFILLFSMAKMDEPQYEKMKESVSKEFGQEYTSPAQQLAKSVNEAITEAGIGQNAKVQVEGLGVTVAFESTLFFETLSAEVKPEGRAAIEKLAASLLETQKKQDKQYQIVVEGHTDARPILAGTFPSNWELSGSRASRVVRHFLEKGFAPARLTAIGYGDTRPQFPSRAANGAYDETALAKNRRVVLRILDPKADSIPLPSIPGEAAAPASASASASAGAPAQAPAVASGTVAGTQAPAGGTPARAPASAAAPAVAAPSAATH